MARTAIDVVVLDLGLPDGNGLDMLSDICAAPNPGRVVVLTASGAKHDLSEALRRGASSYLHKPADPLTLGAQVRVALAQRRSSFLERATIQRLESHLDATSLLLEELPRNLANHLSRAWDLRNLETGAHVRRIATYTERLALCLGMSVCEARNLGRASMLHDFGKVAIPDAILNKPRSLTDAEFAIMKQHTVIGAELLGGLNHPFFDLAATIARNHHERWDGSGYPDGLIGKACTRAARIVGIVDVYDALTQDRCYKRAWQKERVDDYFLEQRGRLFEARLVDELLKLTPEFATFEGGSPSASQSRTG
jgi:putative two-component system response regulator